MAKALKKVKDKDSVNEQLSIGLGAMSLLAIMGLLVRNSFDTNEILSSVINFTQVAIPVIVLIVTSSNRRESKSFLETGKEALAVLKNEKKQYIEIGLSAKGKKKVSTAPDTEEIENDEGVSYMFLTNEEGTLNSKLIPLAGLEYGELSIYAQRGMLAYVKKWGKGQVTEDDAKKLQEEVRTSVETHIQRKYSGLYVLKKAKPNDGSAILIDFDEFAMGRKKYYKAVYECAKLSYEVIMGYPNKNQ